MEIIITNNQGRSDMQYSIVCTSQEEAETLKAILEGMILAVKLQGNTANRKKG